MENDTIAELREILERGHDLYNGIKQRCEEKVVRWEWTTAPRYSILPYSFEMKGAKRGKVLKETPEDLRDRCRYGFDRNGKTVIERRYLSLPGRIQCYEKFLEYDAATVRIYDFDYDTRKPLLAAGRAQLSGGQVQSMLFADAASFTVTNYIYEGERLATIDIYSKRTDGNETRVSNVFVYDAAGVASILRRGDSGATKMIYQRRSKVSREKVVSGTEPV